MCKPATGALTSASVDEWLTAPYILPLQDIGQNVLSPTRHMTSCAESPIYKKIGRVSYVGSHNVVLGTVDEIISLRNRLSQATVHLVTKRAREPTDHMVSGRARRDKVEPRAGTLASQLTLRY